MDRRADFVAGRRRPARSRGGVAFFAIGMLLFSGSLASSSPDPGRSTPIRGRQSFLPARTASSSSRQPVTIVCSSACSCRQMAASMRATMTEKKSTRLHSAASVLNYTDASRRGSSSF